MYIQPESVRHERKIAGPETMHALYRIQLRFLLSVWCQGNKLSELRFPSVKMEGIFNSLSCHKYQVICRTGTVLHIQELCKRYLLLFLHSCDLYLIRKKEEIHRTSERARRKHKQPHQGKTGRWCAGKLDSRNKKPRIAVFVSFHVDAPVWLISSYQLTSSSQTP